MPKSPVVLALLCALFWGLAPIFEKVGLRHLPPLPGVFVRSLVVTAITGFALAGLFVFHREGLGEVKMNLRWFLWIAAGGISGGLLAQFDCGFAAPDRQRIEIVGSDATLVLDSPFLPAPDGPPPSLTMWRGRDSRKMEVASIDVPSVDQYAAEVDDLTAAVFDGAPPRVGLAFSRGTIATLVELDQAARVNAGPISG